MARDRAVHGPIPLPASTFSVSTVTDGNARTGAPAPFLPKRWPDCTLSLHRAEEYDRPVTQSTATPEPTVLSKVSCRPFYLNIDRFHSLACYPGAPLAATQTRLAWAGKGDCRPRTTWRPLTLFGQPGSPSFANHWRYCHAETVPRQDVNSSFLQCVCHTDAKVPAHTQVLDPRESRQPGDDMPWRPHLPGHHR